jgi:hypothetical protein
MKRKLHRPSLHTFCTCFNAVRWFKSISDILGGERAARGGASAPFWRLQQRHLADGRLKLAAIQIGQAVGKAKAGARGGKARGE